MNKDKDPPKLLRVSEVAEQLRLHPQTCYRLIREGSLPSLRVGGSVRVPTKLLVDRLHRSTVARTPR
jgi:excisionase family DNA binding protein